MGWGGDHTAWAFQMPALAGSYRVIAPDNRGAGQSDQPDTPYSIAGMADDVAALLAALGVARAHVCGASMGGMIAQELALRHPERVRTLQLHCTLARLDAYGRFLVESLLRVRAREDREECARAMLPWIICRKTVRERPEFVELMLQRALDNPYPISLAGLRRQADAIRAHDTLDAPRRHPRPHPRHRRHRGHPGSARVLPGAPRAHSRRHLHAGPRRRPRPLPRAAGSLQRSDAGSSSPSTRPLAAVRSVEPHAERPGGEKGPVARRRPTARGRRLSTSRSGPGGDEAVGPYRRPRSSQR